MERVFAVTLLVYLDDDAVAGDIYTAAVEEAVEQWNVEDVQEVTPGVEPLEPRKEH